MELFSGDISDVEAQVIVNAANRIGFMGGIIGRYFKDKGIAESLHYHTKGKIEKEARNYSWTHRLKRGDVYVTNAYNLKAEYIFHAITMTLPGTWSNIRVIELCLENLILLIKEKQIMSIAIPLLGTGVGGVPKDKVCQLYEEKLSNLQKVKIIIVDPSKTMKL